MALFRYIHTQIFKTPYRLLPLAVFTFFVLCFLLHPFSPLRTGQLADPDDFMRLDEVINWLQGQGWFDVSQPRMSPGAHTVIHWSRLVDLPIALIMLPFIHALGLPSAAMIASWIVPPLLFGIMLWLATALAKQFVGADRGNLASLLVLFTPAISFNFTPGRVDHHGYEILIAGFGMLCLNEMIQNAKGWRYAIAAAIAFTCGLWIGTEALPWVLLFLVCLSFFAAWNGGFALRNAAVFGGAFATASTIILFVALPPSEFSSRALSWFSPADVILAALAAAVFLVTWIANEGLQLEKCRTNSPPLEGGVGGGGHPLFQIFGLLSAPSPSLPLPSTPRGFDRTSFPDHAEAFAKAGKGGGTPRLWWQTHSFNHQFLRVALIATLGCFAALLFIIFVPDILNGPFADYDDFNATIALDNISEARPLSHALWIDRYNPLTWQRALNAFIHSLFLPLLALGAIAYNFKQSKKKLRQLWCIQAVFLSAALILTLFWQVRIGYFMELFTLAPLTWLLCRGWDICGKRFKGRPRFWAEVSVFILLGPLPVILLPAFFEPGALYRDIVLFPAARGANDCAIKPAADFLSLKYRQKDITIMTGMNEGPEMLFRTPYNVIGGNFNVPGNPDVFGFFNARDDAKAKAILQKWHAGLVMTCRNIAPFLAGLDHPRFGHSVFLQPSQDGKLHVTGNPEHQALIEKLVNGQAPAWLKPVEIPGGSDYLLFEVRD